MGTACVSLAGRDPPCSLGAESPKPESGGLRLHVQGRNTRPWGRGRAALGGGYGQRACAMKEPCSTQAQDTWPLGGQAVCGKTRPHCHQWHIYSSHFSCPKADLMNGAGSSLRPMGGSRTRPLLCTLPQVPHTALRAGWLLAEKAGPSSKESGALGELHQLCMVHPLEGKAEVLCGLSTWHRKWLRHR